MNENRLYEGLLIKGAQIERSFSSGSQRLHVLRGLDIEVFAGEMLALYGPSGSGKTTLLNILGTLDKPDAGRVELLKRDITHLRNRELAGIRRKQIGFIFQSYALMNTYTAFENVDLVLRLPGFHYFERRKRSQSALEMVGLSAWSGHYPHQLSGGQRQRVAIARALALRPAIILADEPTSGLDSRTSRQVLSLFREIADVQGTSFVIVSHDPVVADFVDRSFDLEEGVLVPRLKNIYDDLKELNQ
ncbi:ABC transporter ATP-binding protein [Anaerolineales bacterium]